MEAKTIPGSLIVADGLTQDTRLTEGCQMQTAAYIAFVGISIAVIVVPGPSILLIIANSLQAGVRPGLYTVAGTSIGMLIQLSVALIALMGVVTMFSQGLAVVRWLGIGYLAFLGVQRLQSPATLDADVARIATSRVLALSQGFMVSVTNPTTMLFFLAFFPQFLSVTGSPVGQLIVLAATFWSLALVFDVTYALVAARAGDRLLAGHERAARRNRLSGAILIAAAVVLVFAKI